MTFNVAGAVDLQKLAASTATTVNVQGAATVSLPSLTSFHSGTLDVVAGQRLTANALTQASDTMFFASTDQGLVMNALASVSGGGIFLNAGAHIMLPALTTLLDVPMQIQDGAQLDAPALTSYTADRVGILLSGGILNAPALRNLSNIDLAVSKTVSTMSLPGVTSYSWTLCGAAGLGAINAGDAGSKIDLSGVQTPASRSAHFAALVKKLQPKHITDPAVGAALAADAAGAPQGVSTL